MTSVRSLLLTCAVWSLLAPSVARAQSPESLSGDIAAQPLAQALTEFASQTGLQLVYVSEIAATQLSKGAPRGLAARDALERLLEGTGLHFEFLNDRTVRIFEGSVARPPEPSSTVSTPGRQARRRGFWPLAIEEVVVTATRREEQLSNVPISIAVWTEEAMEASGIKGMSEIGALTPGVEFDLNTNVTADLYTNLVIRGVTDRHGATTGVFIDDAPVPAARAESFGRSFPWAFDLDRVEVLRGPQSTLLGAGTLGGAVRFIFNQPSLTAFTGLARTEFATTARGDASYEAGAAAGGPVIPDVLGLRVSAWYRSDGGYVDYVDPLTGVTGAENANRLLSKSARAALTWAPTPSVRITPSLTYESFSQSDPSAFYVDMSDPKGGVLRNGNLLDQPSQDTFYLGSLNLTAGLGFAELSTVTSYYDHGVSLTIDWSPENPVNYGDATAMPYDLTQTMFSQEARLTSVDPDAVLTWTAGVFYSRERKRETTKIVSISGLVDSEKSTVIDQTQREVFGQIGLRVGQRFTASGGVRVGRSSYDGVTETPPISRAGAIDTSVTPRFDLAYRTDADTLFYLTVAEGYRSGDISPPVVTCGDAPTVIPADTLWSYEVGAKTNFLDGWVHFESSVFHMEWYNEQPDALFSDGCTLGAARSTAASNGLDLMAQALVTERLKLGLAVAYTDAYYTQTLQVGDAVIIHDGDALGIPPQVPSPWNVTASIDYHYSLSRDVTAELGAEDIFHGRNPGPFVSDYPESPWHAPGYRPDPSTNVLNLRAKVRWPSFDLSLFANNVLDSQPSLGVRPGCPGCTVPYANTFRPRTVGLSASWRF